MPWMPWIMILRAFTYLPAVGASFVHLAAQVPWQSLPGLDAGLEHAARAEYELGVQAWNLRQPEQGLELFLRSAQKGHQVGETFLCNAVSIFKQKQQYQYQYQSQYQYPYPYPYP
ncbi:hypothetical protein AK812_SmicGene23668 [Symbiodinium microadriaticum]|uniref:Uncharacterized protein n=1 Tax=Symbiodinium microadriaticum TaxID=2951 RepID=A0A1Q9DGI5_SYMMI|nr:hypothetical protein AK812_SmicGene23668 [Symbiodinium microadriaticum]